ncbi:MAG TPA: hypothetical protein VKV05_04715, partial [Terriglobales bacterium]|nr:hypothetical protein [Terriglobales bacterium]
LYGDGECELGKAGLVHVVENLRATPFRNLVIELLPRVGELRRGPAPQRRLPTEKPSDTVATPLRLARAPKAEVLPHFESNRIAVYRVDTDAGCETELTGPAIVASPYDSEIELEGPEGNQKLRHFCHLTWLAPSQKAILRGLGQAVVFQLGRRGEPHSSRLAETAATGPSQELATATSTVTMHRK